MSIQPSNKLHPDRYISVHKFWIRFYGQWFADYPSYSLKFWMHMFYRVFMWIALTFFPLWGEITFLYYTADDVGKFAQGSYLMLSEAYMYFKLLAFLYNKKQIQLLIEHLKSDDFYAKETEHLAFLKTSLGQAKFVSHGYLYICMVAISVGCIIPIAEGFKMLPTNVQYPYFDVMSTPAYQILYIVQVICKPSLVVLDGVLDTIMPAFIAQALGQLDILSFNLENIRMISERSLERKQSQIALLSPDSDIKQMLVKTDIFFQTNNLQNHIRLKLGECIKHHTSIIQYVYKVEDAFSAAAAMQFMLSGLVICLIGVQILSIDDPLSHPVQLLWMSIYFACMIAEVFMLCWFGDDLITRSTDLQQAIFNSQWLDLPEDIKRSMKIFMERVKMPMRLTAGKIFILSLDTFTNLLKWSYNAFAVMRSMKS